jgi:hypothetical protein
MSLSSNAQIVNSVMTVGLLLTLVTFTGMIPIVGLLNYANIKKNCDEFEGFSCLFGDFKANSLLNIMYNFWFLVRRIIYAVVLIYL